MNSGQRQRLVWRTLDCKTIQMWWLANMEYKHSKTWLLCCCFRGCPFNWCFVPTSVHPSLFWTNDLFRCTQWSVPMCLEAFNRTVSTPLMSFLWPKMNFKTQTMIFWAYLWSSIMAVFVRFSFVQNGTTNNYYVVVWKQLISNHSKAVLSWDPSKCCLHRNK